MDVRTTIRRIRRQGNGQLTVSIPFSWGDDMGMSSCRVWYIGKSDDGKALTLNKFKIGMHFIPKKITDKTEKYGLYVPTILALETGFYMADNAQLTCYIEEKEIRILPLLTKEKLNILEKDLKELGIEEMKKKYIERIL